MKAVFAGSLHLALIAAALSNLFAFTYAWTASDQYSRWPGTLLVCAPVIFVGVFSLAILVGAVGGYLMRRRLSVNRSGPIPPLPLTHGRAIGTLRIIMLFGYTAYVLLAGYFLIRTPHLLHRCILGALYASAVLIAANSAYRLARIACNRGCGE